MGELAGLRGMRDPEVRVEKLGGSFCASQPHSRKASATGLQRNRLQPPPGDVGPNQAGGMCMMLGRLESHSSATFRRGKNMDSRPAGFSLSFTDRLPVIWQNPMTHYERAIEIQQRLDAVLNLVAAGQHSTPQIADELSVSTATVSRCLEALRKQGHAIKAENRDGQWCYRLHGRSKNQSTKLAQAGKP